MENILPNTAIPTFSVSELATSIRQTLEGTFGRIRLRGEVSGFKKHTSGHLYLSLKDESALISGVCWRGMAMRLPFLPEDGMEIIAIGRLTTYGGRSQYQIIIENIELAGQGALLKLLEERKKKLLSEGLFNIENKKPLPFLPLTIGVITSPTGAVFRDILHRLEDRFPCHVILWPAAVQGDNAQKEILQALWGFQGLDIDGSTPLEKASWLKKPDLLILARGGGSLEDLWCFNEEAVVRAVAKCSIPIITAVGHETDTTLVDFAADKRAPTPTGAAEMSVPVKADLLMSVLDSKNRQTRSLLQKIQTYEKHLDQVRRPLETISRLVDIQNQRLDDISEQLPKAIKSLLNRLLLRLSQIQHELQSPKIRVETTLLRIKQFNDKLQWISENTRKEKQQVFQETKSLLRSSLLKQAIDNKKQNLKGYKRLLESLSYSQVLKRGFALVSDSKGSLITSTKEASQQKTLDITFHDGPLVVSPLKKEKKKKTLHQESPPQLFD